MHNSGLLVFELGKLNYNYSVCIAVQLVNWHFGSISHTSNAAAAYMLLQLLLSLMHSQLLLLLEQPLLLLHVSTAFLLQCEIAVEQIL